jgi:hypothetical protein
MFILQFNLGPTTRLVHMSFALCIIIHIVSAWKDIPVPRFENLNHTHSTGSSCRVEDCTDAELTLRFYANAEPLIELAIAWHADWSHSRGFIQTGMASNLS